MTQAPQVWNETRCPITLVRSHDVVASVGVHATHFVVASTDTVPAGRKLSSGIFAPQRPLFESSFQAHITMHVSTLNTHQGEI